MIKSAKFKFNTKSMIFFGGGVSIFSRNACLHLGGTSVFRGEWFRRHCSVEYKSSFRVTLTRPRHMVLVFNLHPHYGKIHPVTCHESPEGEQRYSSTLSLDSVPDHGARLTPRPGRFNRRMTRYPVYRRLGGP